jgi:hypothetical protein
MSANNMLTSLISLNAFSITRVYSINYILASCCSTTYNKTMLFPSTYNNCIIETCFIVTTLPMSSCWLVDGRKASENRGYEKALCGYNITCLNNKYHTPAHQKLRKWAKYRSSHRKDQQDLQQDHSQQTVVEQHHCTGPISTKDVCTSTYIVEQTQGSTWQLKTLLTHRDII